jgi:hypothetical protein
VSEMGFVVGGQYANAAGDFGVLAIDGNMVRIRYANGFEMTLPGQGLWAQWEALVAQRTGRPVAEPRAPAAPRSTATRATAPRREASSRAAGEPSLPRPKKGAGGEAAYYTSIGYIAAGCEITASVAGRDYPAFAQRYRIHTGRSLVTPHTGLDVHERPTHRIGADLSVTFPADVNILSYLDFGKEAKIQPSSTPGQYVVTRADLIERLFRLGFDLGLNNTPAVVREKVPQAHQINFDRGISLRRVLRR